MTDPWVETIIAAVLLKLQAISGGEGYYSAPARIQRYDRADEARNERPWITLRKVGEGKILRGNSWDVTLTLDIEAAISAEEDSIDGVDTDVLVGQLQDDIERAIMAVDWEAIRAKIEQIDITNILDEDANDPEDGLRARLRINYAHDMLSTRAPLAI